jgi:hypothetical protein
LRYLALAEILSRSESRPADLTLFELSLFSQNGEDGVLAEIFRRIGSGQKFFVEIGASSNESNCLSLADVFNWSGLFVEADVDEYHDLARKFGGIPRVQVVRSHVTNTNFDAAFLTSSGVPSNFDVLSIDIDGNDYWIWEALKGYEPRVVVIEFNASLDPNLELVQPYEPDRAWDGSSFYGASLGALQRLASKKGYNLVHVDLTGANAFFVRKDVAGEHFVLADKVAARAANYFLYGIHHENRLTNRTYLDLTREEA